MMSPMILSIVRAKALAGSTSAFPPVRGTKKMSGPGTGSECPAVLNDCEGDIPGAANEPVSHQV